MVVTVNHTVSHGLRLSPFILPFAIMVVPDTLPRPGGKGVALRHVSGANDLRPNHRLSQYLIDKSRYPRLGERII